jgi:hypothetical protein
VLPAASLHVKYLVPYVVTVAEVVKLVVGEIFV